MAKYFTDYDSISQGERSFQAVDGVIELPEDDSAWIGQLTEGNLIRPFVEPVAPAEPAPDGEAPRTSKRGK